MRESRQVATRLLESLAAHGVLGRLALFNTAAWQQPCAGEWTAALTNEEYASIRVDARNDRADAPIHGVLVGVGATVRPEGNGGSVSDGTTNGVPLGLIVGVGLKPWDGDGDGEGEGDGLGHASEPTRFQL